MNLDTIFLLDSDVTLALSLEISLKEAGFAVHIFSSSTQLLKQLPTHPRLHKGIIVANEISSGRDEFVSAIRSKFADVPFILSIARPCVRTAVQLMRDGAAFVLSRPFSAHHLLNALNELDAGVKTPESSGDALEFDTSVHARLRSLSPRQKEILVNVFEGRINKVIAHRLGISIKTVELHRAHMMRKMQASSAVELIKMTLPLSKELCSQVNA